MIVLGKQATRTGLQVLGRSPVIDVGSGPMLSKKDYRRPLAGNVFQWSPRR
jgi:hypothetical protein